MAGLIVVLAGGTGGAKLARGLLDVVGPERLAVVANTADDFDAYGVHVSPDPDLVTYWLADRIDERGWGIAGDTWQVMDALEALGRPTWFRLGDADLACCLIRTAALRRGERLTAAHADVARAMGVAARVLPMADEPVRTVVRTDAGERPFQEFMILDGGRAPIVEVRFDGMEGASPTSEVAAALGEAEAIVIGPSNPVISIGPILGVPGMRDLLRASAAPIVAVSPWVDGRAIKGPTDHFAAWAGLPFGAAGVEAAYPDLLDAIVTDETDASAAGGPVVHRAPTLMQDADARRRLAEEVLRLAEGHARRPSASGR